MKTVNKCGTVQYNVSMELTVKQILQSAYKKSSIVIITVNVRSHTTTYSNGFQFSNGKCFTSCFSSAWKKFASVQMTCPIHSEKTAWVVCSEKVYQFEQLHVRQPFRKFCIHSNSLGHPFRKK